MVVELGIYYFANFLNLKSIILHNSIKFIF
jgi:hypothetical protein